MRVIVAEWCRFPLSSCPFMTTPIGALQGKALVAPKNPRRPEGPRGRGVASLAGCFGRLVATGEADARSRRGAHRARSSHSEDARVQVKQATSSGRILYDATSILQTETAKRHLETLREVESRSSEKSGVSTVNDPADASSQTPPYPPATRIRAARTRAAMARCERPFFSSAASSASVRPSPATSNTGS